MKNLTLFLLFLAISLTFSDDTSPGEETPGCERTPEREGDTLEICKTLTPTDGKYCCLFSYELDGNNGKSCISIKQDEYDDRDKYITYLFEGEEIPADLKAKIYCDGDTDLPEDDGDNGDNPDDEEDDSITCKEYPDGYEAELDDCKKLTPAKGKKCCLLSYDNGIDKGNDCISLSEAEYKDRNKAITKFQQNIEGYENAKGEIICDGDKIDDASFIALKITKGVLGLLLIFL